MGAAGLREDIKVEPRDDHQTQKNSLKIKCPSVKYQIKDVVTDVLYSGLWTYEVDERSEPIGAKA